MKKIVFVLIAFLFVFMISVSSTKGQKKVDLGEAEFSYAGIYVRANVGLGAGMAEWIEQGTSKGGGISVSGRLGYRFSKGIGLHAVVSSGIYTNITSEDWDPFEKLNFVNIGGGPTFFIGKGYSYIILEVVYTKLSIDDGYGFNWETSGGVGGTLATGYDFNIAKNFGLGLCIFGHVGSMKDDLDGWTTDPYSVINLFYGVEVSLRFGK